MNNKSDYGFSSSSVAHTHSYLMPVVEHTLKEANSLGPIFELGCGNGSNAAFLTSKGYDVIGVDPSESGIAIANKSFPECRLEIGSTDDDLSARFGTFDILLSLEVIEHVFSPKRYVQVVDSLLNPGGLAIISTPYHGYLKNVVLALSGKMDSHFTALWEGGHIKFWSPSTITTLFQRASLQRKSLYRVGRVPAIAKSMVVVFQKGAQP